MTERIEFTGKSVDEAVMTAMKHFKTTRDNISVRIVEEGSKGLFGFGAKDAKIVASMKEASEIKATEEKKAAKKAASKPEKKPATDAKPEKKAAPKKPATDAKPEKKAAPKKPAQKKTEEKKADVQHTEAEANPTEAAEKNVREVRELTEEAAVHGEQAATEFLTQLIEKMALEVTVTTEREKDCVKVVLHGDGVGALIGRRGETLDSVQYLTNLYANKKRRGDDYCRIVVDSETYRAKRHETLVRLANSMAAKAVKYHKDMSLEPMTPYERRIIHSALQNTPNIKTRSVGEEPNRRIIVMYKR